MFLPQILIIGCILNHTIYLHKQHDKSTVKITTKNYMCLKTLELVYTFDVILIFKGIFSFSAQQTLHIEGAA